MSEIPLVKVLTSIEPANSGTGADRLEYEKLYPAIAEYSRDTAARTNAFWASEEDSLEELLKARELASDYFLRTAGKVATSEVSTHDLWADRFTQASIELYSEPDKTEAAQLIKSDYELITQLLGQEGISQPHVNYLLEAYKPMLAESTEVIVDEVAIAREKQVIREYGEAVKEKYRPLFELVDQSGKAEFTAGELLEIFSQARDWLINNDDPEWSKWTVTAPSGTTISIDALDRLIKIASRRESANAKGVRGLIGHELLVHALRSKNGYKTGDDDLGRGLPGYLDAEEGYGILVEEAVTGELPDKAYDRYLDIAIALGSVDGQQKSRREVFEISFARQLVRGQAKGAIAGTNAPSLERRVWAHVDRIYRGGRGDNLGLKQAIFTKDIAYYAGYKKMTKYLTEQVNSGKTVSEVFEYLSQAKIDPTNPQHVERLASSKR